MSFVWCHIQVFVVFKPEKVIPFEGEVKYNAYLYYSYKFISRMPFYQMKIHIYCPLWKKISTEPIYGNVAPKMIIISKSLLMPEKVS